MSKSAETYNVGGARHFKKDGQILSVFLHATKHKTTKRLKELESRQEELERQILIERSKQAVKLKESDIREFYKQAILSEPQMLINYFVKEIILFDDKIEIYFNSPIKISPDNNQGFSFYSKTIKLAYKIPQRRNIYKTEFAIVMRI